MKLNAVLIRGRNEQDIFPLIRFARQENLLLRFIELMPVTSQEMLTEANFLSIGEARRRIENELGPLIPDPEFKTNGPALYYRFQDCSQRIGFI